MSIISSNFAAIFAKDCYGKQNQACPCGKDEDHSPVIASVRLRELQGSEYAGNGSTNCIIYLM